MGGSRSPSWPTAATTGAPLQGALNLDQLGSVLAGARPNTLLVMSFVLIMCGFLVKAAVVPFHFWLADAYAAAPAPAAVLFSAVMSDLGLYAVAEIYWTVTALQSCQRGARFL